MTKSTVDEIRQRFDNDVERFSSLETGQSATIDSPLCLDLIARAAAAVTPGATRVLDVGCGAGNYTLKLLEKLPGLECTLMDLSRPMLDRAGMRVSAATAGTVTTVQADVRETDLGMEQFDVIVAAAVLHHLRGEEEWRLVFDSFYRSLSSGGSFWIFDLVTHEPPVVEEMMWNQYGDYLTQFKGPEYRDTVFAYLDREDTPRSLAYQMDLLREVGFTAIVLLHKNGPFAAFGGVKG